ncbi:class B sortase [Sedimentibacter hydroxybenzoicus]|nr:class B sortase [Sedimentibacter hydroxybenzoicus]
MEEAAFEQLRMRLAEAEKEIVKPADTNNNNQNDTADANNSHQTDMEDKKKSGEEHIIANYASLSELNDDYIGWIKISNTNIDYPVMYTPEDPEHYLRRAFDKTKSISGTPFVGKGAGIDSDCFIIYGHNMGRNDTIMFGTLDNYKEKAFWEENRTFSFYTASEKRTYEVFAAMETRVLYTDEEGLRYYYYSGELSEADFSDLTEWLIKNAIYDTDIVPVNGEQILILSTCSYQTKNGRFVVAARLVNAAD